MALFSECALQCAQKVLDADIVRDGDFATVGMNALGSAHMRCMMPVQGHK